MKKILGSTVILLAFYLSSTMVFGAEEKKSEPDVKAPGRWTGARRLRSGSAIRRPNLAIIFGKITKIDSSDPAKATLEVKNETDGTTHKVDITPWTNVTKVTDISELKTGDNVRIMARKVEEGEVAMTVVFGKIRNIAAPRMGRPVSAASAAAPAKEAAQK